MSKPEPMVVSFLPINREERAAIIAQRIAERDSKGPVVRVETGKERIIFVDDKDGNWIE
jgi:hypothetical protein